MLTKSKVVLSSTGYSDGVYSEDTEGDLTQKYTVMLDVRAWEDMGKPETITVTIEPGDTLN